MFQRAWLGLAIMVAMACGSTPAPSDGGPRDGGPGVDGGMRVDGGGMSDGGVQEDNDSFATADPLTLGTAVDDVIQVPGDLDYYSFTATEGQWIAIATAADDPTATDTVIQLFDSSMTMVAENDDGLPRSSTNSEILYHVPTAGTYYVAVQEFSSWMTGETPEGGPTYAYTLLVQEMMESQSPYYNFDGEAGDDLASAQAIRGTANGIAILLGTFQDETDADVYRFTVPGGGPYNWSMTQMPMGPMGYGSTSNAGTMWITTMDGSEILARVTSSMDIDAIAPSLVAGEYLLWVRHPAGAAGANDFYVLKGGRGTENPLEMQDATNGVIGTPETITLADDMGVRRGYVLARLTDGDVDHFAVDLMAGDEILVVCGSRTSGSGVTGLSLRLTNADGTMEIGTDTETDTEAAVIGGDAMNPLTVATGGTYVFRIQKTGQDAEVTGDWVRCGVAAQQPMAP
ncbi:MAG: PPC domain-containing protein [Sandaracinaceae bacterium]|nr:PPC domain-containing protein [Sandaracinaceae bacterium]